MLFETTLKRYERLMFASGIDFHERKDVIASIARDMDPKLPADKLESLVSTVLEWHPAVAALKSNP